MHTSQPADSRLAEVLVECERLRDENRQLKERFGIPQVELTAPFTPPQAAPIPQGEVTSKSSPDQKVKLFRSLFRGRDDAYALRWEGRNGKTGYSPACRKVDRKSTRLNSSHT